MGEARLREGPAGKSGAGNGRGRGNANLGVTPVKTGVQSISNSLDSPVYRVPGQRLSRMTNPANPGFFAWLDLVRVRERQKTMNKMWVALIAVLILIAVPWVGVGATGLTAVFGWEYHTSRASYFLLASCIGSCDGRSRLCPFISLPFADSRNLFTGSRQTTARVRTTTGVCS